MEALIARIKKMEAETPDQRAERLAKGKAYTKQYIERCLFTPKGAEAYRKRVAARDKRVCEKMKALGIGMSDVERQARAKRKTEARRKWKERDSEGLLAHERAKRQRAQARRRAAKKAQVVLSSEGAYRITDKSVPPASKYFPKSTRLDVIADLCLATLEGKFPVADLAAHVKDAIRPYNNKAAKELSLDAPAKGSEGKQTYLDRLEGGL